MVISAKLRWAGAVLLAGGAAGLLALLTLTGGGFSLIDPASAASHQVQAAVQAQTCSVHTYTTDSPKESAQAFGPKVAGSYTTAAIPAIVKELDSRRACDIPSGDTTGDPYLLAAHYAMWSDQGLTKEKVAKTDAGVNAFAASLIADQPKWQAAEKEIEALESASTKSIGSIPAGSWTMYMAPSSGQVTVHVGGKTIGNGTMIVFTHGTKVVRYRLDCGFQPVVPPPPAPPKPAPQTPATPATPGQPYVPPTTYTPTCANGGLPPTSCLQSKLHRDDVQPVQHASVQPNDAYEPPQSVAKPASPAPVHSSTPVSRGPAPGATPAPSPRKSSPPVTGTGGESANPGTGSGGSGSGSGSGSGGSSDTDPGNPFGGADDGS